MMKSNEIDHIIIRVHDKNGDSKAFDCKLDNGSVLSKAKKFLEEVTY